jgi:hypothetical protein
MNWMIIVFICCLAAGFAVWKEYKRRKRSHLVLRTIAALLAVIALACIALPIKYSKDITSKYDQSVVLLTAGFNADSLTNYKGNKIFTTDRSVEKEYPKAKLIRLDELKNDSPAITKVHVFGYGLNKDELKETDGLPVVFHPASAPGGIIAVGWNPKLKAGEALKVQGKYKNDGSHPVKLVLSGLNTQLDTVNISAKTNKEFELNVVPKNEGRMVYHLQAITGRDTISDDRLPVEIDPIKPLKILMLSASPDFETRFLKNWLSENGFSVTVRSIISRDKFSSEFVNMPAMKIDQLNEVLLDKFDLVIGDLSVLKPESALLKQQVTQKGLGVIIRADSTSKSSSWLQNDFPVERLSVKNQPSVSLLIRGKKEKSAALKVDPIYIRFQPGTQPLVNDVQDHLLVSTSLAGAGRVIFTTFNNTYSWMLAGDKEDYAAFWSLLINKATRKVPVTENWSVGSQLPVSDESVQLQLSTSSAPSKINADSSFAAPEQNPLVPFEWNTTYWPESTGWHSVKQNNGGQDWWYVYEKTDWQGVKASESITATRRYAENYGGNTSVTKAIHEKVQIEVSKIYFYLLLLMAITFLWVEGKLAG